MSELVLFSGIILLLIVALIIGARAWWNVQPHPDLLRHVVESPPTVSPQDAPPEAAVSSSAPPVPDNVIYIQDWKAAQQRRRDDDSSRPADVG